MIVKLVHLFIFWRRNNLPSIVFKSLFWGVLAWLAVGIFSSFQTALIGGLAASILAACKYSIKYFKRRKQLLKKVGGDKEKLRKLQLVSNKGGLGGALMNEMLNAELDMDHDDFIEEEQELTEEQRAQNKAATAKQCKELSKAIIEGNYASEEHCQTAFDQIMEDFEDGRDIASTDDLLNAYLPQCLISFCNEDYCNDNDHASLLDMFAESTLGKWDPGETTSSYDEESGKWLLHFYEGGDKKTWRFKQSSDYLNEKFVNQLVQHTRNRSGHIIEFMDDSDFVELISLPPSIHNLLYDQTQSQAA